MVAAVREAVGGSADILFGTHGQFTPAGAVRMAKAIEPYDPLWFEEPVPPDMPEVMAEVAAKTSVPIATGERLTTKYEFAQGYREQGGGHTAAGPGTFGRHIWKPRRSPRLPRPITCRWRPIVIAGQWSAPPISNWRPRCRTS